MKREAFTENLLNRGGVVLKADAEMLVSSSCIEPEEMFCKIFRGGKFIRFDVGYKTLNSFSGVRADEVAKDMERGRSHK